MSYSYNHTDIVTICHLVCDRCGRHSTDRLSESRTIATMRAATQARREGWTVCENGTWCGECAEERDSADWDEVLP